MINRLPAWFKQEIPGQKTSKLVSLLDKFKANTICQQAKCPNLSFCFQQQRLTFLILGDSCSRSCQFCAVASRKSQVARHKLSDTDEPQRIAQLVKLLGLKYVVITSVTRDDLADGGAAEFSRTIALIRNLGREIKVEVLIPDFGGNTAGLKAVIAAQPTIIGHNLETVLRIHKQLKPQSDYFLSLQVIRRLKELAPGLPCKSSMLLGLGESEDELIQAMRDLLGAGCDILTLGQYLAPSLQHYPVQEFISLEKFNYYQDFARHLGFKVVLSGPLVRSSYRAEEVYNLCMT